MDPIHIAVPEEIALEGLEGLSLEGLWFRLSERLKLPLPFPRHFQTEIWKMVVAKKCFDYYELPVDRPTLHKLDRKEYFLGDHEDVEAIEQIESTYYIYKYFPVDDVGISGSCEHYRTRKKVNISIDSTLEDAENIYGKKLVIVGSQNIRNAVLIPKNLSREVDINNAVYCLLERIGRSRYFGEMTSGTCSINEFVKDSKLLHYHRSILIKYKLATKQSFQRKYKNKVFCGALLHLPRFYNIVKDSSTVMVEKLYEFLSSKPTKYAECDDVRKLLKISQKSLKNLVKSKQFENIFELDGKTPFRKVYPNATEAQYMFKSINAEKSLNSIRLIDPKLDIYTLWPQDEDVNTTVEYGFLDCRQQRMNMGLAQQAYDFVQKGGESGVSQYEIGKYFGLSKLNSRAVVRKLQRDHGVSYFMKDEGRQRVSKYITKSHAAKNNDQMIAEMTKLLMKAEDQSIVPIPKKATIETPLLVVTKEEPKKISVITEHLFVKPEPQAKEVIQFNASSAALNTTESSMMESADNNEKLDNTDRVVEIIRDSSFIDNVEDVKVNMRFLNHIPGKKTQEPGLAKAISHNKVSQKVLQRMNCILDTIKEHTVIDHVNLMYKIKQSEQDEDLQEVICRKSLFSLLGKLAADNFIKVVEIELVSKSKEVKMTYFGEPNVTSDMYLWQSILEEEKLKHFVPFHRRVVERAQDLPLLSYDKNSIGKKLESSWSPSAMKYDNFPKFIKMKLFHEFLFYIIYNYPVTGNTKIPIQSALETWRVDQKQDYAPDIEANITCVYSTEIDWRMFVPPLNSHRLFESGWGFLRDIIHRIPLILYVKFTKCTQEVPGLEEFLHHPIKCNYLLHFLPAKMREQLLRRRKYVFVIDELCKRLCYAGLLQFGPQKSKEKDQVFVYLNRNAALHDTTASEQGYMEVSPNIEYPEVKFRFDTMDHVHDYWTSMFNIATNTKLNKRNTAVGKDIVIEQLSTKEILQKCLKVQSPLSAPLNDNGVIPGDRLGAAGLDKAFLVHLKQSWNRSMVKKNVVVKARAPESTIKRKNRSPNGSGKTEKAGRYPSIVSLNSKSKIIRRVAPRKESELLRQKKAKKMQYDNVDREALKLMKSLRVSWSDVEDRTLLMCKVAVQFVFPLETQYCHYINTALFRDVIHFRTEKALNKTSRACQRRMANIWKKNTNIREQVTLYLEELRSNKDFMQKYDKLIARLKQLYSSNELVQAIKVHIVEMIHRIHQLFCKYQSGNPENLLPLNLPDDIQELHENYLISNPNTINVKKQQKYLDPVTVNDVEISLLMSLIHSAVCCSHDKTSYTMQLFDIYKNFNDGNLSQALEGMRQGRIIAINKTKNMNNRKLELASADGKNILPYAYSPFHLSIKYQNQHYIYHTNCEVFMEYQHAIRQLSEHKHGSDYDVQMGTIYMMVELIVKEKVTLRIKMAPKLVSLDPSVKKIPVSYEKLQTRFHDLMKYVAIPKDDLQLKSGKKAISFHAQDETYVYQVDPMELFCNIDQHYIHVFCILRGMTRRDSIKMGSFTIAPNDNECCLQNCVTTDSSMSFMERCWRIATSCKDLIKEILDCQKGEGGSNKSANLMNKSNFLNFVDEKIIEKRLKEMEETNRKVYGEKKLASLKPMTARCLLEAVMRLATEGDPNDETSTWITDYKKLANKDDDEEIFDMEDVTTKDQNLTTQSKDADNDTLDHLSSRQVDMFVVNISKVFVEINQDVEELPTMGTYEGRAIHEKLIPFTDEFRNELLDRVINNAKWKPEHLMPRDLNEALDADGITDKKQRDELLRVLEFVESTAQMGAKYDQFNIKFPDKQELQHNVKILQKMRLLLRTGVNEIVFVHWNFASLWLIETYNVLRAEKDSLPKLNKRDIKKNMDSEPVPKKLKMDEVFPSTSRAPTARLQVIQEKQMTKEAEEIFNNRERFKIRPYPWIRINGSLNRRVLDKWLGVILLHLSTSCGAMLKDLNKKFNGLMLFDLRYLLEVLEELGCVEMKSYIEPKVTLFSSYVSGTIAPATDFDEPKTIYVELADDAMHRLAFFIGKKKYKSEFV
ncbi:unnamed protein product [Diamesa serratosioi]